MSFNLMAAATVSSDFGNQERKLCQFPLLHFFFFFCHEVLGRDAMIFIVLNVDSVDMNPSYSHISFKKMIEY